MSPTMLKRLGIILGALVLLWGAFALAGRTRGDRQVGLERPKIDTAAVDTVLVMHAADTTHLARGARGAWTVNGHAAAGNLVSELLGAFADTAQSSELVAQSKTSHVRLGVTPDSGHQVRVISHGRTLLDLTAGKRTPDFTGVYVKMAGQDAVYTLRNGGLADAFTRPTDDWRDKRIVAVAPESVAVIELRRGARSYVLARDSTRWTLGGAPADSIGAAGLLDQYRTLDASGFATPAQTDSADFAKADATVRLLRKDKTALATLTFDSTGSGVWVRADAGTTVFKLDAWRLAQLVPADSTLRVKQK